MITEKQRLWHRKNYRKNKEKIKLAHRLYRKGHGKNAVKNCNLKRNFGIDLEEYEVLFNQQDGKCSICHKVQQHKMLAVDHNHLTGKIRGLLCSNCNVALGLLSENVEAMQSMILYVKRI